MQKKWTWKSEIPQMKKRHTEKGYKNVSEETVYFFLFHNYKLIYTGVVDSVAQVFIAVHPWFI